MAEGDNYGRRLDKLGRLVVGLSERISTEEPALRAEPVGSVA